MKSLLALLLITLTLGLAPQQVSASDHVILAGGPALRKWENLRVDRDRHDRWWANFIRGSTMRMDNIRAAYGPSAKLIWLVHRKGYIARAREDGKPYTTWITEQATKRGAKLIWVEGGPSIIKAINSRPARSITTFDFFGHSNRHCFLLDYSSEIIGACTAWLHEKDLYKIKRSVFAPNAICKSWGCHTGESMNVFWRAATGREIIGAHGKTDYAALSQGKMPAINGSWVFRAPR
ncbi:MAG: hypothetical protein ACI9E1_002071 [Cryomorphaceae bacterium]|jgi:hypothetical protein